MAYTYADMEDRSGTIYNKKTDIGYQKPADLAKDLGIAENRIDWKRIKPPKAVLPQYVRQKGTAEVYDVSDKLPRYVDYGEAIKNNIWKNVKENDYLYNPYKDLEVHIKDPNDKDYNQEFGKEGGYLYFGNPTKIFIRKGTPTDKQKAIVAHEIGHWLTKDWQREEYIKNLGYPDTNDNDVITLSEKMANDYEAYKLGQLSDPLKIKKFKQLERQ